MVEKAHQDSSAAARIRNNQRRSRARHREFVEELKARVRDYERQGVQATLEMREAARKVALENSRLRSLLMSRGITSDEINHYLASFDSQLQASRIPTPSVPTPPPQPRRADRDRVPPPVLVPVSEPPCQNVPERVPSCPPMTSSSITCPIAFMPNPAGHQQTTTPVLLPVDDDSTSSSSATGSEMLLPEGERTETSVNNNMNLDAPTSALDTLAVAAGADSLQSCCGPITQCSPAAAGDGIVLPQAQLCSRPAESAPPDPIPKTPTPTASHLEMSCTAAARIVASMYKDGSEELAREALGCSGPDECLVKNTVLFQLLDRS